ncbi:MAG: pilus assembly protein PilM, partial [Haloferula sp.]
FEVSFSEAEAHKTQGGLVALGGGHTEQLDEATAALAMCIRNAMTRLATEIPRTTNYYRSQHGGSAPKRVYLAGGGANLPYAKEFFEEKLRLPVEYFNPLPAIQIASSVDTDVLSREAHTMGELIGLGLRSAGKSKLNIDLVPAKVGEARAADKRKPFLIAAAAILIAGAAISGVFKMQAAGKAAAAAQEVEDQLDLLRGPSAGIQSQLKKEDALKAVASSYLTADSQRIFWPDLYAELNEAFASEAVWLTELDPIAGYDPFAEKKGGKSVVGKDFDRTPYGQSSLEKIEERQQQGKQQVTVTLPVNAVRLKGFWLKNPDNQNIIFKLLGRLQENAKDGGSHFTFAMGEGDQRKELEQSQLATIEMAPAEGEFAAPFELILPLADPVPFK